PEWENYRKKYISFIFQEYNIIDSFTVLQNVELALSYIDSPSERRARALELIERVGLTKFKNHKGSKLSGGQKQRTVIARALAKDSPIILADEPTGNLDAKTSEEIIALLAEISKDKLVIVVTHTVEELQKYATREIRIFDGTVERDETLRKAEKRSTVDISEKIAKPHNIRRGIELGWQRFRSMPKLSVFMCALMVLAILGTFFSTLLFSVDLETAYPIFVHRDGRLVITRQDGNAITDEELKALAEELDAKDFCHYDYLYDSVFMVSNISETGNRRYAQVHAYIDDGSVRATVGHAPENENEVMLALPIEWLLVYGTSLDEEDTIKLGGRTYNISGVHYYLDNTKMGRAIFSEEGFNACVDSNFANGYQFGFISLTPRFATDTALFDYVTNIYIDDTLGENECYFTSTDYRTIENIKVAARKENIDTAALTFDFNKNSQTGMSQGFSYPYGDAKINLDRCKVVTNSNDTPYVEYDYGFNGGIAYEDVLIVDKYAPNGSVDIYISRDIADDMFKNLREPNYMQASLFFGSDSRAEKATEALQDKGYFTMLSSHTYERGEDIILSLFINIFMIGFWLVTLLFLGLFLYVCSARAIVAKRGDIAILRSMGIENKVIKISMYAQTAIAMIPSFVVLFFTAVLIYTSPWLNPMFPFMHAHQYALILLGMLLLNLYISRKYNKKMFKESVRKTLKGGAKE
ncbi:MAG: ATP-binding cassette domain-containing protein, partial [Clostridia bacterium]|nr:ATP-binding cassette domain-containing protein [Clostridia bacterium]